MFLTPTELADLTGVRQKAAQRRWLARNAIPFCVRTDGRAVVSREHVQRLMTTRDGALSRMEQARSGPVG